MTAPCVSLSRDGSISRLRLDRAAKGNSLSNDMVKQLDAAIDICTGDGTQALLIEGEGTHFCTGFDLSDLDAETDDSLLARFVRVELMLQKIYRAPFITAALAHGKAWGAGADLFATCALRWARPNATFAFPGAAFGLVLGSGRLAELTDGKTATAWITRGNTITAREATDRALVQSIDDTSGAQQAVQLLRTMVDRLDTQTLTQIRAATRTRDLSADDVDLVRLVNSAARPGLKVRIAAYRDALRTNK